jgi:Protein of unknown function (DUF3638)
LGGGGGGSGGVGGGGGGGDALQTHVGACAVLWTLLQRCHRCLRLLTTADGALTPALRAELSNLGRDG